MNLHELSYTDLDWHNALAARLQRTQPDAHTIPDYFLASTFPRIGGRVMVVVDWGDEVGLALLFPRQLGADGRHVYTLRTQPFQGCDRIRLPDLVLALQTLLPGVQVIFYDPLAASTYRPDAHAYGSVEICHPSQMEAEQIPVLQQQVWGGTLADCYPADLHALEFAAGTSLVAQVNGELAGFLLGFYKFGGHPLPADWQERYNGEFRLESQIMAVLPHYRGMRIANLLKRQQALDALAQGIGIVNWTVDPLQYANASLNFGLLRAMAFDFTPNYYPFRNQLNRVPASRFGITWLVQSRRVQDALRLEAKAKLVNLAHEPSIVRINGGWQAVDWQVDAPMIAIEIPADWTALQRDDLEEAIRWREVTDRIFAHYVGKGAGQYVITDVGGEGERRYLIGQQGSDRIWKGLSMV